MPALHGLADRPVLLVDQVPEVAGVGRVEVGRGDRVGARRAAGTRSGCGRPPAAAARTPPRGRPSTTASGSGRPARPCAGSARPRRARAAATAVVVPVIVNVHAPSRCGMPSSQSRPVPPPPNAGTSRVSSGMHRAAVVALVVVLGDHLPVRRDVVGHPQPGDQVAHRVVAEVGGRPGDPVAEGLRRRRRRGSRTRSPPTARPRPGAARSRRDRTSASSVCGALSSRPASA